MAGRKAAAQHVIAAVALAGAGLIAAPLAAQTAAPKAAAPAAPPPLKPGERRINLSPAGLAVAKKYLGQPDPQIQIMAKQSQSLRAQMDALVAAPTVDLVKIEAVMKQQEKLQGDIRARGDSRMMSMLKELPAADRGPFLKQLSAGPGKAN